MTHPIELNTARTVQDMRLDNDPKHTNSEVTLASGVYFSWDADGGDVTLDLLPKQDVLFAAKVTVQRKPGWLSFNLSLREGSLEAGDILGLVLDFEGCAGETLPLFIRSARSSGMNDTYLQEPLQGQSSRAVQTLLHTVHGDSALCGPSGFHTLVFNLPMRDFDFVLHDLRLFVLPAARCLDLGPPRLGKPV
ncbi:hypothetical protein [Pelagimonas varians]|uniref:hypothetical protein n=1 Tax=Pelagimonas varians TaxID=696760 RepID=UPI000D91EB57|nr:hypothetical protein [Pelagimonas varians]PYG26315.1 hypothetical protein C8N36_12521 [Pelagimonas varians]